MCSPSAAHPVFAVAELLEKIILEVIQVSKDFETSESGQAKASLTDVERYRKSFMTKGVILKRVSRGFNEVIIGSTKIQNEFLTPVYTAKLSSRLDQSMHRIWWMGTISDLINEIEQHFNRLRIRNPTKRYVLLSSSVESSWRKMPCLQRGMDPITIELSEKRQLSRISVASPKKLLIDEDTTLGEVYEEMVAIQKRVSETERVSRTAK
ncbi:hypothetical protein HII31_03727 [Pseudocercospora fuligena]|uniref:Uncharacterized protein n=1 Tax=Pseudocercospora fuligena TaxID=685502 RepID=A0A8H6VKD1_9PEZI|nr:hypothetical protein HII31_03727 [Pseudocercospora fuligena]